VFVGLIMEKAADWMNDKYVPLEEYKPHKPLENLGWIILMLGILAEIVFGFALAAKDELEITAATNAARNANVSDMTATVRFFVKKTHSIELTNLGSDFSSQAGTMYLFNRKGESGYVFDMLTADKFVRKNAFVFGEPNMRDNQGYFLRFQSENWNAFMGNESPVKQIDNIHWVRVDINFLTNGAPISGGAIELVANNFHKFFSIPPQTDTNPPDGTIIGETHFPYLIFATNVGIMHKTEVKRRKMLKSCG